MGRHEAQGSGRVRSPQPDARPPITAWVADCGRVAAPHPPSPGPRDGRQRPPSHALAPHAFPPDAGSPTFHDESVLTLNMRPSQCRPERKWL